MRRATQRATLAVRTHPLGQDCTARGKAVLGPDEMTVCRKRETLGQATSCFLPRSLTRGPDSLPSLGLRGSWHRASKAECGGLPSKSERELSMVSHAHDSSTSRRQEQIQGQPELREEFEASLSYVRLCLK